MDTYEKKYDEALKWMRELYPELHGATKEDAEHYFPELRESEDERMMREFNDWLCEEIECRTNDLRDEKDRRTLNMLCYILTKVKERLEKQKEHSMSAEEVLTRAGLKPYKDGNQWCILAGDNIQEGICGFGDTIEGALYEFLKEVLDFPKEQKPESCDCSRDEESYTNGIHHVLMNPEAYGLIKQKPAEQLGGIFTSYDMAKTFTEGQNYVIAHPEKFGLCKPAEWDDYTKTNLDRALQIIKNAKGNLQGYQSDDGIYECDKAIECLEHFLYRGLEIEKPAEWSEEDADILNCCISSIEEAKENRYAYKETDGDTSYDREIDWLKSLRPVSKESLQPQQNMSISFMLYLDEHRPDGKMCLSNAECNEIETAFKNQSWDTILRYVEKYQPHWKPSNAQINYLGAAVIEAQRRHNESVNGFPRYHALKELYEQLLKL